MKVSIKDIERLKAEGKIKGFNIPDAQKPKIPKDGSKIKSWIELNLKEWCDANGLGLVTEHRFHDKRKWRFDFAIVDIRVAVEYEGLMSSKSRHTTIKGFTGDAEKYTQAAILGWRVLRYTALNYRNIIKDLEQL